ncbi:MAG: HEAT repeat domain-containing protein [Promethearchaeota archaeon]
MKLELLDSYPEEVKDYVKDYNKAVEAKDIMEVDLAINGLVSLVFSSDEQIRFYAIQVLSKIANLQYKFLKNAVRVLLHRYKGDDPVKSDIASMALGKIVVGTPASALITDKDLLDKIIGEERERISRSEADKKRKEEFLKKVQENQLNLSGLEGFSEIYQLGIYYNRCIIDEKKDEAFGALQQLTAKLFNWLEEGNLKDFGAGCLLLERIAESDKKHEFMKKYIDYLLGFINKGKANEKKAAQEILIHIFETIQDIVPEDLAGWLRAEKLKRKEQKEKELKEREAKQKFIQKVRVTPSLKWDTEIQKLAALYNDSIIVNNQKGLNQVKKSLEKFLGASEKLKWKSAAELLKLLLEKVPDFVKSIIHNLVTKYRDPKNAEILAMMIEDIEALKLIKPQIIEEIKELEKKRLEQEEALRKQKEEERKRIEKIIIKVNGDWDLKLIKFVEKLNQMLLKKNENAAQKMVNNELKVFLSAKEDEFRFQSQEILVGLAEKYPKFLEKIVKEFLELFNSDNPARFIAVEAFGKVYHAGFIKNILPEIDDELVKKIEQDYDDRRKELENLQMAEKIKHIKIDVQTIKIDDNWPKDIKKICRTYNDAILKQDMPVVVEQVKKIVDIFMNEKKEERLNSAIKVLGNIAKKNIELIAPTINILLEMVDSDVKETKYRAIKALGEVTYQRPGWAYMGIDKLMKTALNDKDDEARMKAMLELSKVGKKNATMLVEYVPDIIKALSEDKNKHVRRLAAWTLGAMAEVIPLEAKEAIPALTDALHDDYILVRKFADKALQLIRTAMRKA